MSIGRFRAPVGLSDVFLNIRERYEACLLDALSGARRFEELLSWQRMHELNLEVWKATEQGGAAQDFDFRRQIRDAAGSAERNIAEGFGRYNPAQFANFLDYARGSACETKGLIGKARGVGYFTPAEADRLDALVDRGLQAVAKLQCYLRSPEARRNAGRRYALRSDGNGTADVDENVSGNAAQNANVNGHAGKNVNTTNENGNDPNGPKDPNVD